MLLLGLMSLPLSADISYSLGGVACSTAGGIAGLCTPYAAAQTISFDGLAGTLLPQLFLDSLSGPVEYTTSGSGSPFVNGSVSSQYAAPGATSLDPLRQDVTDYLTVGSPNRPSVVNINFLVPMFYFGFYMGSPDTYNQVRFTFVGQNGQVIQSFSGDELIPPGNQSWAVGEYVNFFQSGSTGFTNIVMSSTSAAFETDNHAYSTTPVPDGGTTASLLGLALALGGLVSRKMR